VVLGNSLGGAVAIRFALERPDLVSSLVLVSPGGAPLSDEDVEGIRHRFDLRTRADARRFMTELLHRPPWYLRVVERSLVENMGRPIVQTFLKKLGPADYLTVEELKGLVPPARVIWGKSDRILPRTMLDFYRSAMPPGTRFEELEAAGHSPHMEVPGLVVRRLLEADADARRRP
jgi:pimeloyl-ACP methyl ester carboxylesterase